MLYLVRYLFVISTSVIDCLGRFVPEMTCYVSSGTLNLTKLKLYRRLCDLPSVTLGVCLLLTQDHGTEVSAPSVSQNCERVMMTWS